MTAWVFMFLVNWSWKFDVFLVEIGEFVLKVVFWTCWCLKNAWFFMLITSTKSFFLLKTGFSKRPSPVQGLNVSCSLNGLSGEKKKNGCLGFLKRLQYPKDLECIQMSSKGRLFWPTSPSYGMSCHMGESKQHPPNLGANKNCSSYILRSTKKESCLFHLQISFPTRKSHDVSPVQPAVRLESRSWVAAVNSAESRWQVGLTRRNRTFQQTKRWESPVAFLVHVSLMNIVNFGLILFGGFFWLMIFFGSYNLISKRSYCTV